MPQIFTHFASSRFIDRERVVAELRTCAERLRHEQPEVKAVYLFGSFATGAATPRSDADIVVEVGDDDGAVREAVREAAAAVLLDAPVPVDLFVLSSARLAQKRGVAGAVAREGVLLA